jgi:hypothetical protein
MEKTKLYNLEEMSDIEKNVSGMKEIMSNTEFGLVDTNFLRVNPVYTPELSKKFKKNSDPFINNFISLDKNSKCLELHTTEDLTQTKGGYVFYANILIEQENIHIPGGVLKELNQLLGIYGAALKRLSKKERSRGDGIKREENLSKLEEIKRTRKSLKRLVGVLEKKVVHPDYMSVEYSSINKIFPNNNFFPSEVDKDLVKSAFYYLFTEKKEVSIFSNDIHIPQLVSTLAKRTNYESRYSPIFSKFGSDEKRVINVYYCLDGDFSCKKFLEESVCKK